MTYFLKCALCVLIAAFLQGCATPYAQFYQDRSGGVDVAKNDSFIIQSGAPRLIRGASLEEDFVRMHEDGYSLLGISTFNAAQVNENGAIDQAKKVQASIVIVYSKYSGTVSGVMPMTTPNNRTSTTNLTGTAYGSSGGYANYSGVATTTTYGTQTTYVPYAINRADYFASYWIKIKPPVFGLLIKPMTQEVIKKIGTNKGVLVDAVIKGSPAFDVDILRGDVLSKMGESYVYDGDSFHQAVRMNEGNEINLLLYRDGREIKKTVKLRNRV
jgi:hypothetical protein